MNFNMILIINIHLIKKYQYFVIVFINFEQDYFFSGFDFLQFLVVQVRFSHDRPLLFLHILICHPL